MNPTMRILISLLIAAAALTGQDIIPGHKVIGRVPDAKRVSGKPVCGAGVTTNCVPATDAAGNLAMVATLLPGSAYGFDWYVDSVNGDDGNDGKTQYTALKTIAKLLAQTIAEGQSIGLAANSHWDEQLTVPANNVTVAAYGFGARPLLDGSDPIAAASWTKTGGQTNVYQASVPLDLPTTSTSFMNVWENGAFLKRATSLADCDATPGTYWRESEAASPITLYIHPPGSTDPTSNGKLYEYARRNHGLASATVSGGIVLGIHTRRNRDNYGSLYLGPNSVTVDCLASDGNMHNVLAVPGTSTLLKNVEARNSYYTSPATLFVHFKSVAAGETITYEDCHANQAVVIAGAGVVSGFGGHRGASGTFGTITYRRCKATNVTEAGFSPQHGSYIAEDPVLSGTTYGFSISANWSIAGATGTVGSRFVSIPSGAMSVSVTGANVTVTNAGTGIALYSTVPGTVSVTDSTITSRSIASLNVAGMNFTSLRNTFNSASTYVYSLNLTDLTINSDYNAFNGYTGMMLGGVSKTLAEYRMATSQDYNSTPAP
jgi:hypothetical protein